MLHVKLMPEPNGPGWEADGIDGTQFMVWAPRPAEDHRTARDRWVADWTSADGNDGEHVHGDTPEEVLRIFPNYMRVGFQMAITRWQYTQRGDTEQ